MELNPHRTPIWFIWLLRALKPYMFVFCALTCALGLAMLAAPLDALFGSLFPRFWPAGAARNAGWLIGLASGIYGQATGKMNWVGFFDVTSTAAAVPPDPPGQRAKVLPTAVALMGFGVLAGHFAGMSLAMCWLSLSLSPWPPAEWLESIRFIAAPFDEFEAGSTIRTSNPLPLALYGTTVLVLAVVGFVVGGIGAATGWLTDEADGGTKQKRWRWPQSRDDYVGLILMGSFALGGLLLAAFGLQAAAAGDWLAVSGRLGFALTCLFFGGAFVHAILKR